MKLRGLVPFSIYIHASVSGLNIHYCNSKMSIGNNENRNNDFRNSEQRVLSLRTAAGLPQQPLDYRKILPDFRNWFRISGTVVGPPEQGVGLPDQLPEILAVAGSPRELPDSKNSCSIYGTHGFCFEGVGYNSSEHHASRWKTTAVHCSLFIVPDLGRG
jgi:hypothetical protein